MLTEREVRLYQQQVLIDLAKNQVPCLPPLPRCDQYDSAGYPIFTKQQADHLLTLFRRAMVDWALSKSTKFSANDYELALPTITEGHHPYKTISTALYAVLNTQITHTAQLLDQPRNVLTGWRDHKETA